MPAAFEGSILSRLAAFAVAALMAGASAALSEDAPPPASAGAPMEEPAARAGRYTMVPAEGGFVRLDTETGIVSHCRRETGEADASWRCAAISESVLAEPDRTGELEARIGELERRVGELEGRIGTLEAKTDAPTVPEPEAGASPAEVSPLDDETEKALDFSEELMRRFFGLVREMKDAESPGRS